MITSVVATPRIRALVNRNGKTAGLKLVGDSPKRETKFRFQHGGSQSETSVRCGYRYLLVKLSERLTDARSASVRNFFTVIQAAFGGTPETTKGLGLRAAGPPPH